MTRRRLSDDEAALWRNVAETVTPLKKKKRVAAKPQESKPARGDAALRASSAPKWAPSEPLAVERRGSAATTPSTPSKPSTLSPLAAGDPAIDRKARKGRIAVERTLDLHGLTQDRAHASILAFLESARADGVKCVRVITGKGGGATRGVLRRRFLEWIEAAPFRPLVVRVAPAEPGPVAGAYFVFIKGRRA